MTQHYVQITAVDLFPAVSCAYGVLSTVNIQPEMIQQSFVLHVVAGCKL